jgi:Cys-rich protein (TIGR01571 family)
VSKVALAQVMERVKHTPCFRTGTRTDIFREVRFIEFSYYIIILIIGMPVFFTSIASSFTLLMDPTMTNSEGINESTVSFALAFSRIISIVRYVFMIVVVWYMRYHIRKKYSIPEGCCQDCCCVLFCNTCSIAQMMRHTADYDAYVSKCCTATGVPNHAPFIV